SGSRQNSVLNEIDALRRPMLTVSLACFTRRMRAPEGVLATRRGRSHPFLGQCCWGERSWPSIASVARLHNKASSAWMDAHLTGRLRHPRECRIVPNPRFGNAEHTFVKPRSEGRCLEKPVEPDKIEATLGSHVALPHPRETPDGRATKSRPKQKPRRNGAEFVGLLKCCSGPDSIQRRLQSLGQFQGIPVSPEVHEDQLWFVVEQ